MIDVFDLSIANHRNAMNFYIRLSVALVILGLTIFVVTVIALPLLNPEILKAQLTLAGGLIIASASFQAKEYIDHRGKLAVLMTARPILQSAPLDSTPEGSAFWDAVKAAMK